MEKWVHDYLEPLDDEWFIYKGAGERDGVGHCCPSVEPRTPENGRCGYVSGFQCIKCKAVMPQHLIDVIVLIGWRKL